jgi:hypothetical protein
MRPEDIKPKTFSFRSDGSAWVAEIISFFPKKNKLVPSKKREVGDSILCQTTLQPGVLYEAFRIKNGTGQRRVIINDGRNINKLTSYQVQDATQHDKEHFIVPRKNFKRKNKAKAAVKSIGVQL